MGAKIVNCTVTGTVDIVRFPKRPRIRVEFFPPAAERVDGEDPAGMAVRLTAEIRERAPHTLPGRKRTQRRYRGRIAAGLPPRDDKPYG